MLKILLIPIFFSLFIGKAFSQEPEIFGTVKSSADSTALPGATVVLEISNSSEKNYQVTDKDGRFRFQKSGVGEYTLEIRYLGFKKRNLSVRVEEQERLDLGNIYMEEDSIALDEVQVIGQVPMAEQLGDTIQFNAAAFKVNPDASAEDLILKMPGITIIDGNIQAQGEEVVQVLVDGKRFFDGDANTAIRNLPAEIIENIQVFDKKSDQAEFSGYDDGNRQKTINIVTKENRRKGQFGKASAAYGTDHRYMLGTSINAFQGDRRFTFTGITNNINMQDYSIGETPGGGMRGRRGRRGGAGNAVSPNGTVVTNNIGLNYNDNWGEKVEVSGNYSFSRVGSVQFRSTVREFIAPADSGQVYQEENMSDELNQRHRANLRLEYKINDRNRLLITPNFNIQNSSDESYRLGMTENDNRALNRTENTSASESRGLSIGNNILYSHRFNKIGRTFSTRLSNGYSNNSGETFRLQDNRFYSRANNHELVSQLVNNESTGYNWQADISYSEPIGDSSRVQLEYRIGNRFNDSDRKTFDLEENGTINSIDTLLSNTFTSDYITQGYEVGYQYNVSKLRLQFGVEYQKAKLGNEQEFPYEYELDRTFYSMLPELQFEYRFSRSKNLRFDYSTNTNAPSVGQLQEVIDNSNPLQLRTGNPNLEQTYQNRLNLRYQNFDRETNRVFFMNLNASFTENTITNATIRPDSTIRLTDDIVLERGSQLTKPVNLNGEWNIRSNFNWGRPLEIIRSNVNLNGSVVFSRRPGMINDQANFTNTTSFNLRYGLSSNISENLDFNISSNSNYNLVENTLLPQRNNNYFNQSTQLRVNWIFWKGLVYRTELNQQLNAGLSTGFNTNYLLWNMSISKKILKNQRGELSLSVNDLLEQNVGIQRQITESYIEDSRSSVLQRYFMLTFSYSIRNFPGGEPERPNRDFRRGGGGRGGFRP